MGKLSVVIALVCSIVVALAEYTAIARLYSSKNCGGASLKIQAYTYIDDLGRLGFDNRVHSARLRGF